MMSILPDCPVCGEDELWRPPHKPNSLKCYLCGWDSGPLQVADGETMAQRYERAVSDAKAKQEQGAQ